MPGSSPEGPGSIVRPRNKIGRRQFKMPFRAIRGRTYSVASSAKATYVADGSGTDGPVVRLARSCPDETADGRSDLSRTTQGAAIWRGTGSSNPSPSSGESVANCGRRRAAGTWADLQAHPGPADRGIPFDDDDLDRIARTANDTSYGLRRESDLPHRQQRRTLHPAVRGSVAVYRG
jgi:hypothetical protein